jgi:hypothetical protein
MTDLLARVVIGLNAVANALGNVLLAPIAVLPGWLSATIVSAVTGVLLLIVFKYTSNQRAIKKVRSDIKANLFALKLFKDSVPVTLKAQGRLFVGAFWLLIFAIVPMLVMALPVLLLLGQLALWYQARPLKVGEDAVVTLKLNGKADSAWPSVKLQPDAAVQVATGPVHVLSKREMCWLITAREKGYQHLRFEVDGQEANKQLAIGDGFMRVSAERPGWSWWDALLNPAERPFGPDSAVQSIEIEYPARDSWTSGTDWWVYYWFAVSMVAALCFHKVLGVSI